MQEIHVPSVKEKNSFFNIHFLELTDIFIHKIASVNWPENYPYQPDVKFIIGHDGKEILLRFFVKEQSVLALTKEDNGKVWTDSCVEFFISFDDTGYYNFEFNCIGKMLLGFRKEKNNCVYADQHILQKIERKSSLGNTPFSERKGEQEWELSVRIPVFSFFRHLISSLSGLTAKANFYKCGDNLSIPHFLSWNPINNPTPNFHLEKDFGNIIFE